MFPLSAVRIPSGTHDLHLRLTGRRRARVKFFHSSSACVDFMGEKGGETEGVVALAVMGCELTSCRRVRIVLLVCVYWDTMGTL